MKYYNRALRDLDAAEKNFSGLYNIVFSFGENIFYEYSDGVGIVKVTYDRCRELVTGAAEYISSRLGGHEKGERIGLWLDNSPEWIVSFWALLMAGFTPVLLNRRNDAESIRLLIREAGIKTLVSDRAFDDMPYIDTALYPRTAASQDFRPDWADEIMLCTSGTSGLPKLCLYNGKAIGEQIKNTSYVLSKNMTIVTYYKGYAKLLTFLPLCHIFGLSADLLWFSFFGRDFVFLKDMSPETIRYTCTRHGVTHLFAIPLLWNTAAQGVRRAAAAQGEKTVRKLEKGVKISLAIQNILPRTGRWIARNILFRSVREQVFGPSVKFCISGGGYVSPDTLRLMTALGYTLHNGYGMTEAGITSVELRLRTKGLVSGAVGKPFPSVEYKLDAPDASGRGELLIRGGSLASAIYSEGMLRKRTPDEWLHTGDLARCDAKGNYYIDGRLDDLIIRADGENLSPDMLECRFHAEHVERLCLLGLDDINGVQLALMIQFEEGATELQRRRALAEIYGENRDLPLGQQVQRAFVCREKLPTVLESKVQRAAVRARLRDGSFGAGEIRLADYAASGDTSEADYRAALSDVTAVIAEVLGKPEAEIGENAHFVFELGGNSLQYFSLIEKLSQRFNVDFKLDGGSLCTTPAEFARYILAR